MTNLTIGAIVPSAHRMSIACISSRCCIIAAVLLAAGCATTQEQRRSPAHAHAPPETSAALTHSQLSVPPAIKTEHEHLHHELEAAIASGGKTGAQASKVAAVLLPHFQEEEAYAMPPLGLLESLARNEPVDEPQARQAIQMAARLRQEYGKMLEEHQAMTVELRALAAAAGQEAKPDQARFADEVIVHAQNEEQVLYPATLVIGEYLKLRQGGHPGQ